MKTHYYARTRSLLLIALLSVPIVAAVNEDAAAVKEFKERAQKYVELHRKVKVGLDPQKELSDPAAVAQQTSRFAMAMQQSRVGAAQGEIFTPRVAPVFKRILKEQLTGPANAKARSMVLGEGNPRSAEEPAPIVMKINARYPTKAPKSSVPPSLLLALPQLPKELEYRFIGRNLILTDAEADIIVDYIPEAVPK